MSIYAVVNEVNAYITTAFTYSSNFTVTLTIPLALYYSSSKPFY